MVYLHVVYFLRAILGPTDFVLDLGTMQKLKAQHPYIMVRCTTNAAPATFGLWLHSSVERNALLNLIER